jgi:hypothetical protein
LQDICDLLQTHGCRKAVAVSRKSNPQAMVFLRPTECAVFSLLTVSVCLSATLGATPQEPTKDPDVSLDRIREELAKPPPTGLKLDMPLQVPVATFKTGVEQRVFVLPLEDWLEKELKMGVLQRQSADWAAKCCGIGIDPLLKSMKDALQRRKERKIREQIARELAQIEAAREKAGLPDK